ncbi:hypothetical protein FDUTEX481_01564 [Tolypothrix sp. PCC 7601]|nr:hypothetical protein FDUTEX481_01564 [Tolypothrix sp. PCC 7601]
MILGIGDRGSGISYWRLGICKEFRVQSQESKFINSPFSQSPVPSPQSPAPTPQSPSPYPHESDKGEQK